MATNRYDYSSLRVGGSIPNEVRLNGSPIYRLKINGSDVIHKYVEEDFDVRPKIYVDPITVDVELSQFSDETTADGTFRLPSGAEAVNISLQISFDTSASVSSFDWSMEGITDFREEDFGTYTRKNRNNQTETFSLWYGGRWENKTCSGFAVHSVSTADLFNDERCVGSISGTIKIPDITVTAVVEGHSCSWTITEQEMAVTGAMPDTTYENNTMTLTFTPIYGSWTSVHTSEQEY